MKTKLTPVPALFLPRPTKKPQDFQKGNTIGIETRRKAGDEPPPPRPQRWKSLITAVLREKLSRVTGLAGAERKTFAEVLADRLVQCALQPDADTDKTVILAITEIIDRTEGKPKQQIDVKDVTAGISERPDADLEFFMEHGYWPEEKIS